MNLEDLHDRLHALSGTSNLEYATLEVHARGSGPVTDVMVGTGADEGRIVLLAEPPDPAPRTGAEAVARQRELDATAKTAHDFPDVNPATGLVDDQARCRRCGVHKRFADTYPAPCPGPVA